MEEVNYKIILKNNVETYVTYDILSHIPKIKELIDFINNDPKIIEKKILVFSDIDIDIFSSILAILKFMLKQGDIKKTDFINTIINNLTIDHLTDFILISNELGLTEIMQFGAQKFKTIIHDNTIDQIRSQYNIISDFTLDEENIIKNENEWKIVDEKD